MEEHLQKIRELDELLKELEGKEKATPQQLVKLFNLHNYFNPRGAEYGKHCPSCVARVYRQVKNIHFELKDKLQ